MITNETRVIDLTVCQLQQLIEETVKNNVPSQDFFQPETDELLTVQDCAKFLTLSVQTVYGLIAKGEIPVMKRSKRCYFSKIDLINYLKQGRKKTFSETDHEAEQYLTKKTVSYERT